MVPRCSIAPLQEYLVPPLLLWGSRQKMHFSYSNERILFFCILYCIKLGGCAAVLEGLYCNKNSDELYSLSEQQEVWQNT